MPMRSGSDAPFLRARAHHADGLLGILERRRMVVSRREAVFQHEGRHAEGIEPARHLVTLVVNGEASVAAPWAYYDAGSGGFVRRRQVNRNRRLVLVGGAHGSRRAVRPEKFDFRGGPARLGQQHGRDQAGQQNRIWTHRHPVYGYL